MPGLLWGNTKMTGENTDFGFELRGYKRTAVDKVINDLRGEIISAAKDRQSSVEEISHLKELLGGMELGEDGVFAPSYADLGGRLESVLRIAEEQSTRVVAQADIEAERIIAGAKLEASRIREVAAQEFAAHELEMEYSRASVLDGSKIQAEKHVADALEEAALLREEAIDEASAIRGAVATEAAKIRTSAQRETEALRAHAAREIAEIKAVTTQELNEAKRASEEVLGEIRAEKASYARVLKDLETKSALAKTEALREVAQTTARLSFDNEKLTKVLADEAQQARSDLEAELGARRAESERELLEAHQKAVEMNTRLIDQAQKQLAETKSRLTKVRREHKMILVAIDKANQTGRTEADRESKKIVADAKKIAAQVVAHAETDAMARVAAAEHRVIELDVERNTIAEYVSSLRAIVGKVVATEEKASKKAAPATKRATSQATGSKKDSAAS